jgi:hypothetical protein
MVMVLGSVDDERTFSNLAFVIYQSFGIGLLHIGSNCSHVCPRILLPRNIPILHFNLCMEKGAAPLWDDRVGFMKVGHLFWVCLYMFTTLMLCFWFHTSFV